MYNYSQYPNNFNINNKSYSQSNNNRLVGGGFLGPFILGGITGGLAAPLFYNGYNRPYYNNYYYYPYPYQYQYYRPYYR